jgi:hypothetical protein
MARLGLPEAFGVLVLTLAVVLLFAPYFADADFGVFKVPALGVPTRHFLQYFGPLFLVVALLAYYPFWPEQAPGVRSAATTTAITVLFQNASPHYLDIDWIDFEGKKDSRYHYSLAPGESQEVATFIAHAWSVTNANTGEEMKSVVVSEKTSPVRIS